MAREPGLGLSLVIVLAMAVIVVAIATWVAPPNPRSASAGSILPREVIYRPQHLNLY
jgi:multisubunit Na+/H+ antiporter MnhB subunit